MKKSASKDISGRIKAGMTDKQNRNSDPVSMVELRSQIITDYNNNIRSYNENKRH